ncbi:MAG: hypothetical protein PHI31_13065 [Desulfuromonadaceae bacterium]|nr:hypothetical protein [Desulfuromonadaceae bacterium]
MKLSVDVVRKNRKWHVPVSIATFAMGICLTMVYLIPSFAPQYHDMATHGNVCMAVPYAIFILVGFPLFTLWYYTKLDADPEYIEQFYEQD